MFQGFLENLTITNTESISLRYGELTAALNKKFRETESKTNNSLQVGSFGRRTAINGISDLDMLYIMPKGKWEDYKNAGQLKLLGDVKDAILERYPKTEVRVDRLVVTVTYSDFHIEVQPVFEEENQSYKYPDTKGEGSWKITRPREEMSAIAEMDALKNSNLRRLCKMARAWKNKNGVPLGGLLIDTLAYNFLESTSEYDSRSFLYYDWLSRDFFKYLSELPEQSEYGAPGSNQRVKVRTKFQNRAKKAHKLCLEAIEAQNKEQLNVNEKWKSIYGRPFPASESLEKNSLKRWDDTEEFIEERFPVDIRYPMKIECRVTQNGFMPRFLREMLEKRYPLLANKKLEFFITQKPKLGHPLSVYWKILNRGEEARRRNNIRGMILEDEGKETRREHTDFRGDHLVECYIVSDGIVVARDKIDVPISENSQSHE